MSEKLKACPFCGSDNVVRGGDDKMVAVFCGTCGACGPDEYGSSNEWNRRTPAPEGEVVAWRVRTSCGQGGFLAEVLSDSARASLAEGGYSVQALYASPVVPVGVGEEQRQRVAEIVEAAIERHAPANSIRHTLDDADAIIAALRTTDTGANHD
jgi:hypothetical protein